MVKLYELSLNFRGESEPQHKEIDIEKLVFGNIENKSNEIIFFRLRPFNVTIHYQRKLFI